MAEAAEPGVGGAPTVSVSSGDAGPTAVASSGHELPPAVPHFVAPSSYLRPKTTHRSAMAQTEPKPPSPLDKEQLQGLVRPFL